MAFNLTASFVQQNDAKGLVVTDTTGEGTNGWNDGSNPDYTDIVALSGIAGTYGLYLDITLTQSDGTETVFERIDLYTTFGPFTTSDDLVFIIIPTMLIVYDDLATAYSDEDQLPDGIYNINYGWVQEDTDEGYTDYEMLLDGVVRIDTYNVMRLIPITYADSDDMDSREIREALFAWSYLMALKSSAFISKNEELLTQLNQLENILRNGSNNPW